MEFAGDFLADKKAVVTFVGVEIEILGHLIVPIHFDADGVEGIEAGVGVAGEKITVGARGTAEDEAFQIHVANARDELDVFEQIGEVIDDEGISVFRSGVERLDHGATAEGAGVIGKEFFEIVVFRAHEDGAIFHGGALAVDHDFGLGPGVASVTGRCGIEALVEFLGGAQETLAFFDEGFGFGIVEGRGAENLDRDHRINDGMFAGVIDFQHDVRAESLNGIEEDGAGVETEVALAGIEPDIVLAQIHGAARENAGVGRNGQGRGVVAELNFVDERAAGITADDVLEVEALEPGAEGVADLMRGEEDAATAIDGDRVGELEFVFLKGGPDFGAGKFCGGGSVEKAAGGHAGADEFFPIGGVGEAAVEEEGFGGENDPMGFEGRLTLGDHLDADAGEGTALGEVQVGGVGLEELHFGGMAGPKSESEGEGIAAFGFDRENLAVGAMPELVFVHRIGRVGQRTSADKLGVALWRWGEKVRIKRQCY